MKRTIVIAALAFAFGFNASASEYLYDFSVEGERLDFESPVLRHETLPVARVPEIFVGDKLNIRFAHDASYVILIDGVMSSFGDTTSFSCRDAAEQVFATAIASPDGFLLEVRDIAARRLFRAALRAEATVVEEVDLAALRHGGCIELEPPETDVVDVDADTGSKSAKRLLAVAGNPLDDNVVAPAPVMVDIMLVFDNGARAWTEAKANYGGSITNFAMVQVAKMNKALENTGLHTNFWFRLVDVATVDGQWTTVGNDIVYAVRNGFENASGIWSELASRREACGADLVSLIIDTGSAYGTTGIGFITKGTSYEAWVSTYRTCSYTCCAIRAVDIDYTLLHEMGHNMGLAHSNTLSDSGAGKGTYPYANGYNFTAAQNGRRYNTIMAYFFDDTYSDYLEIPYFSSPDYIYKGSPVGTTLSNDCTRALRQTCRGIADRHAQTIPLPSDIAFSPQTSSAYRISLSTLGGYEIRYTTDGSTPTRQSVLYTGPLVLTNGEATIKAVAVVDENTLGAVAEKTYSAAVDLNEYVWLEETTYGWRNGYWNRQDGSYVYYYFWDSSSDTTALIDVGGSLAVDYDITLRNLLASSIDPLEIVTSDKSLTVQNFYVFGNTTLSGSRFDFGNWNLYPDSALVLAPGNGNTYNLTNNLTCSDSSATVVISNGTVSAQVAGSGNGCFGNAALRIAKDGILSIDGNGWKTGYQNSSPLVIDGGKLLVNSTESIHRPLTMNGGTIDINSSGSSGRALDFNDMTIAVSEDSEIKASNANGNICIRQTDVSINVAKGKTLEIDAKIIDGGSGLQSIGKGIGKYGEGILRLKREAAHSGVTDIKEGLLEVGYSSGSELYGLGWIVASDATLKVRNGCSLKVPTLTLDSGATISVPAASSAPIVATNDVSVSGVYFELSDVDNLAAGASYPLLKGNAGISDAENAKTSGLPELAKGLKWKLEVSDDTLYASVLENPAVDVLVAFDNGAQAYVASKGVTLSEFATTQIEKMNEALVTNRLDQFYSYRLAGVCKVDGVYNNIDTAPGLIAAGEGAAVSLRAARELCGADTVTLLVDVTGNTLGNSSPLNSPDNVASQHECAFSVCSIRAVDTGKQHTMIHENAHNMGCGHARAQSIINSPFEYGRGFYFKDGDVTRHTIMAYGGDNDASWYFSTSSDEFGLVLGDAMNDNARVLRETCGEVAKWRNGAAIELDGSFATGNAVWQAGRKYPWSLEGDAIRSFNQTNYQYQCTTPLKATITGPKTLHFKHKSYFGGESVAGNNYSHFDVLLDDSPVITQTECTNSWTDAQVEVPKGTHEVVFVFSQRFAMNNSKDYKDGTPEANDAVWIKDINIVEKRIRGAAAVIR